MNRSDFLRSLGLGASGLVLPTNKLLQTKAVKICDNYVRGLNHYSFAAIKHQLKEGDELQLLREPDNPYDSFAIQVNFSTARLGYLAAFENIVLANMLDTGVQLRGFISKYDTKRQLTECLAIEVFAELVIPSPQLVAVLQAEHRADDAMDLYRKTIIE